MKYIISVCLMAILFAGCNNRNNNRLDAEDYAIKDEAEGEVLPLHEPSDWVDFYGAYQGILPSGSGEGIETTLTLYDDDTYRLKSVYMGRGDNNTFEEHGKYTVDGDIITLQMDNESQYYRIGGDYILKLDNERQEIKGNLADQYKLLKR